MKSQFSKGKSKNPLTYEEPFFGKATVIELMSYKWNNVTPMRFNFNSKPSGDRPKYIPKQHLNTLIRFLP